jgi:guanylate kinase
MMMNNLVINEDGFSLPEVSPLVIVISGPSGVGKDAILNRMKALNYPFEYVTTVTTRARRANERNQVDYIFISVDEFQSLLKNNGLLEWANVYGNYYGVPKQPVKDALSRGRDIFIKVDVQGAANIKKIIPEAIFIFIAPPSVSELSNRLIGRCTENTSDLAVRLKISKHELQQICNFDYVVINSSNKIDAAIEEIRAIVTAEKCRATPHKIDL